jgi:hypothetical protein
MVSPLRLRRRAAEMVPRGALTLGEPRAAPVRSGWAGAHQKSWENGGKVVHKRGTGVKICTVKYCETADTGVSGVSSFWRVSADRK